MEKFIKFIKRNTKKVIRVIKEKWIRQTSLTLLLVAIITSLFVALNLIVANLKLNPLDFTQEKIYSLSEDSKNEVKKVEQNVNLYIFGYSEEETPVILGNQYHNENDKITVQLINGSERPDLLAEYGLQENQKIVVASSNQRYKIITQSDMYTYDTTSYQQLDITEQKLTKNILFNRT